MPKNSQCPRTPVSSFTSARGATRSFDRMPATAACSVPSEAWSVHPCRVVTGAWGRVEPAARQRFCRDRRRRRPSAGRWRGCRRRQCWCVRGRPCRALLRGDARHRQRRHRNRAWLSPEPRDPLATHVGVPRGRSVGFPAGSVARWQEWAAGIGSDRRRVNGERRDPRPRIPRDAHDLCRRCRALDRNDMEHGATPRATLTQSIVLLMSPADSLTRRAARLSGGAQARASCRRACRVDRPATRPLHRCRDWLTSSAASVRLAAPPLNAPRIRQSATATPPRH